MSYRCRIGQSKISGTRETPARVARFSHDGRYAGALRSCRVFWAKLQGRLTKTRLIQPRRATSRGATSLFLDGYGRELVETGLCGVTPFVDGDPRHACLEEIVGMGATRVVEQGGGDLGDRLEAAFATQLASMSHRDTFDRLPRCRHTSTKR